MRVSAVLTVAWQPSVPPPQRELCCGAATHCAKISLDATCPGWVIEHGAVCSRQHKPKGGGLIKLVANLDALTARLDRFGWRIYTAGRIVLQPFVERSALARAVLAHEVELGELNATAP